MGSAVHKGRTRPIITADTEFFWQGTHEATLLVQQCRSCGRKRHPPGPMCPNCHSLEWQPVELPAQGRLYSFTVVHHPLPAGFDSPCTVAVIEFDDEIRLISNVVDVEADVEAEQLQIGEVLEAVFVVQDEGWTAHQFRRPPQ